MAFSRKALYGLAGAIVFAACVLVSLHVWLPVFLNSDVFRRLIPLQGVGPLSWQVRRLSLAGLDIGAVSVGAGDSRFLSADAIQVDYDPGDLIKGRVRRIAIIGLSVRCGVREGRFYARGLDFQRFRNASASKTPSTPPILPFDHLEVRNSLLVFDWEGTAVRIPFSIQLIADPGSPSRLQGLVAAWPSMASPNRAATLRMDLDLKTMTMDLDASASGLRMAGFRDLLPEGTDDALAGEMDLAMSGRCVLSPFAMENVRAAVELRGRPVRLGPLALTSGEAAAEIAIQIQQQTTDAWRLRVSDVAVQTPVHFSVSETAVSAILEGETMTLDGETLLRMPAGGVADAISLETPLSVKTRFSATLARDRSGRFTLSAAPEEAPFRLAAGNLSVSARSPRFDLSGHFAAGKSAAHWEARAEKIQVTGSGLTATIPAVTVAGETDPAGPLTMALSATAQDTVCDTGEVTARIPKATVEGRLSVENGISWNGRFHLADGVATHDGAKIGMNGLSAELPLAWPWRSDSGAGRFAVKQIRRDGRTVGSVAGRLTASKRGVSFTGRTRLTPLPGFGIDWRGEAAFLEPNMPVEVTFSANYRPESPLSLAGILPAAKGIEVAGELDLTGSWARVGNRMTGNAAIALANGTVTAPDRNLTVTGLGLRLDIPELMQLESAPAQELNAAAVGMGALKFEDLRLRYQLEPGGSVLLEKGGFKWCGGNVNLQSLRILPGVAEYDLILHCDRINLAELLRQLGAAKAEGEGAVNGRIPVRFKDGVFRFDDGFLYSTPGDGGTIHVTAAEMLTAGIPKDSPQFAQIDLAREALKSYDYEWVRLRLFSEGENLMLRLQFDGKPTRPLPFVYKKEFGGFARVDAGHPGSNFQGIRLDVNLGLPLDRILRYRGLMEMIQ